MFVHGQAGGWVGYQFSLVLRAGKGLHVLSYNHRRMSYFWK